MKKFLLSHFIKLKSIKIKSGYECQWSWWVKSKLKDGKNKVEQKILKMLQIL